MDWAIIGWLGQGCFFSRFLVQWWMSERSGRIVVPPVFWWLSLFGALLSGTYAVTDRNLVFLAGPCVNVFIHGRNLLLSHTGRRLSGGGLQLAVLGVLAFAAIAFATEIRMDDPLPWLTLGIVGQLIWISRFPVQWVVSERRGRPELPTSFFAISLVGSILLLAYAVHTGNPIWIAGMVPGPILYARSLMLCRKGRGERTAATPQAGGSPVLEEAVRPERP